MHGGFFTSRPTGTCLVGHFYVCVYVCLNTLPITLDTDFTIVATSGVDFLIPLINQNIAVFDTEAFNALRVFRALKALKALRVIRTIRYCIAITIVFS